MLPLRDESLHREGPLAGTLVEVRALETLGDLVGWCARQEPRLAIHDVVVQDEYTHDVVVALPGGAALVLDAT